MDPSPPNRTSYEKSDSPPAQNKPFGGFNFGGPSARTTTVIGSPFDSRPQFGNVATQPLNAFGISSPPFGATTTEATHPIISLFGSTQQGHTESLLTD